MLTETETISTYAQIQEIERFLRTIFAAGDLIEIRGLGSPQYGTMRILTTEISTAARAATKMVHCGADVYYALNPIKPDSKYATSIKLDNLPRRVRQTARDQDIACRNAYLLDLDPVRPSGAAASSGPLFHRQSGHAKTRRAAGPFGWCGSVSFMGLLTFPQRVCSAVARYPESRSPSPRPTSASAGDRGPCPPPPAFRC